MKEEDLLHYCRYYKKDGQKSIFYDYERVWIDKMLDDSKFLSECISEYIGAGLREFEKFDDTPLSLKALLFNRFCHWNSGSMSDCVEPFKDFYKRKYIKKAAD